MSGMDWRQLFSFEQPLEMVVRGTAMYFGLFFMLRLMSKRSLGQVAASDLLMVMIIADAASNGMAGDYKSVPDGLLLCATLFGWSYVLDFASARSDWLHRVIEDKQVPLVIEGQIIFRNMRRELIHEEDLMSQLRMAGVDKLEGVKLATLEPDGRVSVVMSDDSGGQASAETGKKSK